MCLPTQQCGCQSYVNLHFTSDGSVSDKTKQANLQRMNGFNPLFILFYSKKTLDLIIYNLLVYIATHIVILRTYSIYKYRHSQSWGSMFCSTTRAILGQVLSIVTCGSKTHTDVTYKFCKYDRPFYVHFVMLLNLKSNCYF